MTDGQTRSCSIMPHLTTRRVQVAHSDAVYSLLGLGHVTSVAVHGMIVQLVTSVYIIIIERKDLGGVMSKRLQGHLTTLKTVPKRECDAK